MIHRKELVQFIVQMKPGDKIEIFIPCLTRKAFYEFHNLIKAGVILPNEEMLKHIVKDAAPFLKGHQFLTIMQYIKTDKEVNL